MRGPYKIGFVQGPQKLNDGSMKIIHPGTIDRDLTVYHFYSSFSSRIHRHVSARISNYTPLLQCAYTVSVA
jgi:hypothetical protein